MATKIKVQKDGVIKEVDARQEKDYAKNGWTILGTNPYQYAQSPFVKK